MIEKNSNKKFRKMIELFLYQSRKGFLLCLMRTVFFLVFFQHFQSIICTEINFLMKRMQVWQNQWKQIWIVRVRTTIYFLVKYCFFIVCFTKEIFEEIIYVDSYNWIFYSSHLIIRIYCLSFLFHSENIFSGHKETNELWKLFINE